MITKNSGHKPLGMEIRFSQNRVWGVVGRLSRPTTPQKLFFRRWRRESGRDFQKASNFVKALGMERTALAISSMLCYFDCNEPIDVSLAENCP
jgi:hypothetical protein